MVIGTDGLATFSGNIAVSGNAAVGNASPLAGSLTVDNAAHNMKICLNGVAPANCVTTLSGGTNYWTLTGNNLYPTTIANNVGIGTASPDYKLTIQNNNAAISLKDSSGVTKGYIGVMGIDDSALAGSLRLR